MCAVCTCMCFCVLMRLRLVFLFYTGTIISIHFDIGEDKYAIHCPNLGKGCYKVDWRTSFFEEFSSIKIKDHFAIHFIHIHVPGEPGNKATYTAQKKKS